MSCPRTQHDDMVRSCDGRFRALTARLWHPGYSHLQHLYFGYFTSKYNNSEFVGKAKGVVSLQQVLKRKRGKYFYTVC